MSVGAPFRYNAPRSVFGDPNISFASFSTRQIRNCPLGQTMSLAPFWRGKSAIAV